MKPFQFFFVVFMFLDLRFRLDPPKNLTFLGEVFFGVLHLIFAGCLVLCAEKIPASEVKKEENEN